MYYIRLVRVIYLSYIAQAGIASAENPDQLLIALEPEAASIYVRRLRMHQLVPARQPKRPLSQYRGDSPETQSPNDSFSEQIIDGMYTCNS